MNPFPKAAGILKDYIRDGDFLPDHIKPNAIIFVEAGLRLIESHLVQMELLWRREQAIRESAEKKARGKKKKPQRT